MEPDLAQLHRPLDRDELRVAARELQARGWTPRDIASAFRLTEGTVRELLESARVQTVELRSRT